jgi:hypothetical protein
MTGELVIHTSRLKLAAVALVSAGFVVVGTWILLHAREEALRGAAIGLASIAFFGFCGGYAVWRLIRRTPALVISGQGIVDNASALRVGFMGWNEIADLREYRLGNQVFLGIVPANLDALLAKQPAWKRGAIRANLRLGAAPVNIPQVVLPMKVSDLIDEIEARFRR